MFKRGSSDGPSRLHRSRKGVSKSLLGSKSILVVEDDPVVAQIICDTLTSLNVSVLTADDGQAAIEILDRRKDDIALVILDYVIPGVHPARLIELIQASHQNIKIILTSGYPESVICEDLKDKCFDSFISKPYEPRTLIGRMEDLLMT